jgi:probable rRNA maturation factor
MSETNTNITNRTKGKLPRLPFSDIKDAVLGKTYELSVVFIGEKRSRTLNNTYRQKDKPTNVLSFSLEKNTGEIFITPTKARREAKQFGRTTDNFIAFLLIHGLCHLKGMEHGSTMEKMEEKICKKFGI